MFNACITQISSTGRARVCGECPVMNNTTASPKIGKQIAAQNRVVSHRGAPEHLPLSTECSSAAHEGVQMACYIMPNQHIIPMSMTSYWKSMKQKRIVKEDWLKNYKNKYYIFIYYGGYKNTNTVRQLWSYERINKVPFPERHLRVGKILITTNLEERQSLLLKTSFDQFKVWL